MMKKKMLLAFLIAATILVFGSTFATADSDNAALVVRLDEGCVWFTTGLVGAGSVHYVETQNGKWTLSCKGDIVFGLPLENAVVRRSTTDDPIGLCTTPFGATEDFILVFAPGGKSSFVCHGDLTP